MNTSSESLRCLSSSIKFVWRICKITTESGQKKSCRDKKNNQRLGSLIQCSQHRLTPMESQGVTLHIELTTYVTCAGALTHGWPPHTCSAQAYACDWAGGRVWAKDRGPPASMPLFLANKIEECAAGPGHLILSITHLGRIPGFHDLWQLSTGQ